MLSSGRNHLRMGTMLPADLGAVISQRDRISRQSVVSLATVEPCRTELEVMTTTTSVWPVLCLASQHQHLHSTALRLSAIISIPEATFLRWSLALPSSVYGHAANTILSDSLHSFFFFLIGLSSWQTADLTCWDPEGQTSDLRPQKHYSGDLIL